MRVTHWRSSRSCPHDRARAPLKKKTCCKRGVLAPHERRQGAPRQRRIVEAFVDELDLGALGLEGVQPAAAGRQAYHPSTMLKIYLYGYLNRLQSSCRLEREAQRNIELMWLTGCLAPSYLGGVFIHWRS